jgi:hypothetical protein
MGKALQTYNIESKKIQHPYMSSLFDNGFDLQIN